MVDDQVAELVVGGLVVRLRDGLGDLQVGRPIGVGTQKVDVVGGDVVIAEQRRFGAEGGDPLPIVQRQARLHREVAEGCAIVLRRGDGDGAEVQAGHVEVVVTLGVGLVGDGEVGVPTGQTDAAHGVGLASEGQLAGRGACRPAHLADAPPGVCATAEAELRGQEHIVGLRYVDGRLSRKVGAAAPGSGGRALERAGGELGRRGRSGVGLGRSWPVTWGLRLGGRGRCQGDRTGS